MLIVSANVSSNLFSNKLPLAITQIFILEKKRIIYHDSGNYKNIITQQRR